MTEQYCSDGAISGGDKIRGLTYNATTKKESKYESKENSERSKKENSEKRKQKKGGADQGG